MLGHPGLDVGAEGKASQDHGQVAEALPGVVQHGKHVLRLAPALVVAAGALAHAPEIGAQGGVAQADEGPGQGLGHLVGVGAAKEGMGMAHQGDAQGLFRGFHQGVDGPGGAGNEQVFRVRAHGDQSIFKRSTTRPWSRCSSMISSMSSLSTKVYQVASG